MTKKEIQELLLEIYNKQGPRDGYRNEVVPPAQFARMTELEVERWDFDDRFLMQRIAKAILD